MEFRPIERDSQDFQQSVSSDEVVAIFRRAYGPSTNVTSTVELGSGMYNNTYRVTTSADEQPVILRVAPPPGKQFRSEKELLRQEYATSPFLCSLAPLLPRLVAADWSHDVISRDWMVQTHLVGVPAPERLGQYPRETWTGFFRQMGEIAKTAHSITGTRFGPVSGPGHETWSEAFVAALETIALDLEDNGLSADDIREVAQTAAEHRTVLDEIAIPRMTLGDFWTVNTMLDAEAAEPTITGVFDTDRTAWADPAADWTIRMALAKQDERTAFWESYGTRDESDSARWRQHIYEVRHLGAIRLERHRLGKDNVADTYDAVAAIRAEL